jgi:predicted permease
MNTFINIVINIVLPIFLLIAAGFIGQKKLKMDLRTLTKLNIYIFVPAVLFIKIYETEVTFEFFSKVFACVILIQLAMLILGQLISKIFGYSRSMKKTLCNSLLFFNSGNYGLSLIELVFKGNPIAVTSQVFVMLVQNVTTNTFGVFQASSGNSTTKKALKNIFKMPSIYVISTVALVKIFSINVPDLFLVPLGYVSKGFVGIALVTLGAQLSEIKFEIKIRDILIPSLTRLIISPLLGFLFVFAMGIEGILARALIIGVSTPSAVNTALIAKEFNNEPEYASQIVFMSTILSALTVSFVIYFTGIIF